MKIQDSLSPLVPHTQVNKSMICQCEKCNCNEEFESIDQEHLLNVIQHGRLNQKQIDFAMKQIGSKLCERCFIGNHNKKD